MPCAPSTPADAAKIGCLDSPATFLAIKSEWTSYVPELQWNTYLVNYLVNCESVNWKPGKVWSKNVIEG